MVKNGEISKFGDPLLPPWEWGVRQGGTYNKDVLIKNVKDFARIMNGECIEFCLIFGTLLGAIRNKDVIDGDSDFDVFCFSKDYLKWPKAVEKLERNNFYIPKVKPLHDDYIIRGVEKIDINWVIPFGKFYVYNDDIYYPREYFDNLDTINLWDIQLKIPSNATQLLQDLYGQNWMIPSSAKGRVNIYQK